MFSNPEKNLKVFGLRENDIVVDLGAGTGFYSVAAGAMVPHGKVYAVEIEKDYLHTIKLKVAEARLSNVEIIWGNVEKQGGTKLRDASADKVIAANILFQVENKTAFVDEVFRILKPGGRVFLSDWTTDSIMQKIAVSKEKAREMFEKKNFKFEREVDAGAHHYGMIFKKETNEK